MKNRLPPSSVSPRLIALVLALTLASASADFAGAADQEPTARSSAEAFKARGPDYDPRVGSPQDHQKLNEIRKLINGGRVQETIDACIELIESGNRQGELLFIYGRALALSGRPGRARWTLSEAMNDPIWITSAAHQLAQDNYQATNYDVVLDVLDRLAANRPDPETKDLFAMTLRGRAYLGTRQNYDEALEVFDEILEIQPDHEEALRLKGVALLGLKRSDEAWEIIKRGRDNATDADLALNATDREAYWCGIQVTFNREAGKLKEAETILEDCLVDHPSSSRLIQEASDLYGAQGRYEDIVRTMRAAHEAAPDDIELRQALVLQLRALGRRPEAEAVLRKAIEITPDKIAGEPWVALAGFLVDDGRLDEGLKAYENAMERLGGTLPPELLFSYGEALIQAERYEDANAIADQTPIEVHRPMIRGRVAYEKGEYKLAQKELGEAAKLWPGNAPIRYYLARAAEGLGDFSTAIEEYRQSMRSDTKLTAAKERLARLHLAEGRVRHAMSILRFSGTEATGTPSPESRLIEIEIQAMLGVEPDLSRLVADPMRPINEIRRLAVEGFSRGLRMRSGPEAVVDALETLSESVDQEENKDLFIGERVRHLLLLDRNQEAQELARTAVKERPRSESARLWLARAIAAGEPDSKEARELLAMIRSGSSIGAEARTTLGELVLRSGDSSKAEVLFREALEIDPEISVAMRGLAEALVKMDRRAEAQSLLETYLAQNGPYDGAAALQLAQIMQGEAPTSDPANDPRVKLTKRAIRFGAGEPAIDFLIELDPTVTPPAPPSGVGPGAVQEARPPIQPSSPSSSDA